MEIIKDGNVSIQFKPKSDRIILNNVINLQNKRNEKITLGKFNLKKNLLLSLKKPNKIKIQFPKLSSIYSSSSSSKLKINFPKIKSSNISDNNKSFQEETPLNHFKDFTLNIFQYNDIDLVRNLNPDSNNNLINNLLFKEQLKSKLESKINFSNYLNKNKKEKEKEEKNEESSEKDSKNDIDGEGNKVIEDKTKFSKAKRNNLFEKELSKKLKEIQDNYTIKKQDKTKINNQFKDILQEIESLGYDIEFLNFKANQNSVRHSLLADVQPKPKPNQKKQNANFHINNDNENKKSEKDENLKRRISVYHNFFKHQKKKDFEKKQKQKKILELRKGLNDLKIPLNLINSEINELRNIEKSTKDKLMKHYLELLYNGKDIRGEGLVWIIKSIWKLGENVPMSFMPTFLDFDAINYLFNMAKISIELELTKKNIMDLKSKLKEKLNNIPIQKISLYKEKTNEEENMNKNNNININKNKTIINSRSIDNNTININEKNINNDSFNDISFKNDFMNKFKSINNAKEKKPFKIKNRNIFLHKANNLIKRKLMNSSSSPSFKKNIFNLNNRSSLNISEEEKNREFKSTVLELSKIFDKKEKSDNLNIEKIPELNEINQLRIKVETLSNQIEEMKKKEIQRIFSEYTNNAYERTYHAPIEVVLGALIGEHSRNIQINNYNIFKKGHLDELKSIRFYEYRKKIS